MYYRYRISNPPTCTDSLTTDPGVSFHACLLFPLEKGRVEVAWLCLWADVVCPAGCSCCCLLSRARCAPPRPMCGQSFPLILLPTQLWVQLFASKSSQDLHMTRPNWDNRGRGGIGQVCPAAPQSSLCLSLPTTSSAPGHRLQSVDVNTGTRGRQQDPARPSAGLDRLMLLPPSPASFPGLLPLPGLLASPPRGAGRRV